MSNKGIREKKRIKARKRKQRIRKISTRTGIAAVLAIGIFQFGFNNNTDQFEITRPTEYRQASANFADLAQEVEEEKQDKVHVATQIGFQDVEIDKELAIEDDQYTDELVEYVYCVQTQYAYQYPNDYSKTEKFIKEGSYLPYFGSENGFSKVKIDDSYYYVNKYGLSKLDQDKQIKVVNGLSYVSGDYPLPADFNPGVDRTARRAFETMRQDMERAGLAVKIASDYRGYDLEKKMFDVSEPDSKAPGTSEHQLGQAFDFFTEGSKYNDKFEKTAEYEWLAENSYKYGFIERYPAGKEQKTGEKAQPWHFRFVGVENAKDIYENDLTLEEYLKIN